MRAKHMAGKVHRASYLSKIADVANTLFMAGHGQGTNAQNFFWQQHYTQGRQLMTTDMIKEICPPDIWSFIDDNLYPGLDAMKAAVDERGRKDPSPHEEDFRAQVRLAWYYREAILQDAPFLWPEHKNSNLFRSNSLFSDPDSPFMEWFLEVLTPAVHKWQAMGDRAHDSIIKQRSATTILDEARENCGFSGNKHVRTAEDQRLLLFEMMRILDARQGTQVSPPPQPVAQAVVPVVTRPPSMPVMPGDLYGKNARLRPLWSFWSKHLASITCHHMLPLLPLQPPPSRC